MRVLNRIGGNATKGQFAILVVLAGLLVFFLKGATLPVILAVLGVTFGFALFILIFRKAIDTPVKDNEDPFEPGSDAYFTYGPGSEK